MKIYLGIRTFCQFLVIVETLIVVRSFYRPKQNKIKQKESLRKLENNSKLNLFIFVQDSI